RHLERVMSLEEEGGYLDEVADMKPNLQSRIESLSRDHARFRRRIREIVPQLDAISEWQQERFAGVCLEIRDLLDGLDQHDSREIDLRQESMLMDEGGEG